MAIYRGYTQRELDAQYDQRTLVPDLSAYLKAWRDGTDRARRELTGARGLSYGPRSRQKIDLFGAAVSKSCPVLVFLHGGAWRQLSLDESGYPASPFVAAGALVAALDFDLVPDVSLDVQVAQARAGVDWIRENIAAHGGDPTQVVLCGHSSGAHLAAMIVTSRDALSGVALISGCYDLEPVRLSARNDYLRLDRDAARRNSPIARLRPGLPPAVIAYGDGELDEFKRQAQTLAERWRETTGSVELIERRGRNHFDMTGDLADPESPLFRKIVQLLSLDGD